MAEHWNVYGIGHDTQFMEYMDLKLNHTQMSDHIINTNETMLKPITSQHQKVVFTSFKQILDFMSKLWHVVLIITI